MKTKTKVAIIAAAVIVAVFTAVIAYFLLSRNGKASVTYPDDFVVITENSVYENADFIELLGYTTSSFGNYIAERGIISFAANADNSVQYAFSQTKTETSEQLGDITEASFEELDVIGKSLLKNGYDGLIRKNGISYFKIITSVKSEAGDYAALQYVTVKNGMYYTLNYYGSTGEITKQDEAAAEQVLATVSLPSNGSVTEKIKNAGADTVVYVVLLGIVILAGVIFAVILSVSVGKDIVNKRKGEDDASPEKIRRRHR